MNRLYVAEPSPTGTMADHRLAARPSAFPQLVLALAAAVGVPGVAAPAGLTRPPRAGSRPPGATSPRTAAARSWSPARRCPPPPTLSSTRSTRRSAPPARPCATGAGRRRSGGRRRVARRARRRPARGPGGRPRGLRRQPGLRRARRPRLRRALNNGQTFTVHHGLYADETAALSAGTCPRPTSSRRGATCAPTTAASPWCSR